MAAVGIYDPDPFRALSGAISSITQWAGFVSIRNPRHAVALPGKCPRAGAGNRHCAEEDPLPAFGHTERICARDGSVDAVRIGLFLHGTTIMHAAAQGQPRGARVAQVRNGDRSVADFANYVPTESAVRKVRIWSTRGAHRVSELPSSRRRSCRRLGGARSL